MRVFIVTGLGYGDETKAALVDYLVRAEGADTVIRFNGGSQRGGNVLLPPRVDPHGGATVQVHHEFHQWGSGTFAGARTHLTRRMLVDPERLFLERDELAGRGGTNLWNRITIDRNAPLVTPFHRVATQVREVARGGDRHGSTGAGIWETQWDARLGHIMTLGKVREMRPGELRDWLRATQRRKQTELAGPLSVLGEKHLVARDLMRNDTIDVIAETWTILADLVPLTDGLPRDMDTVIFEGSQGLLLDEFYGWQPYVTGSTTTSRWARLSLQELGGEHEVTHIGATRAYSTRHGAGPFVTNAPDEVHFPEPHNHNGPWQGEWRQGYTDLVSLDYAVQVNAGSLDAIAVSHMDCVGPLDNWQVATGYTLPGRYSGEIGAMPMIPRSQEEAEFLSAWVQDAAPSLRPLEGALVPEFIAEVTGLPVRYLATGPTFEDRERVNIVPQKAAA